MLYMMYLNAEDWKYSLMNMETGKVKHLKDCTIGGVRNNGTYVYYSKVEYNLRLDMARKLRPRFYRYNTVTETTEELFTQWERSDVQLTAVLPREDGRFFVIANYENASFAKAYHVSLDGADRQLLFETSGYPYGFSYFRSEEVLAYHIAGGEPEFNPGGYAINTMTADGTRTYVYSDPGIVCFGPIWSPDEQWLAFQKLAGDQAECFADLAVCRPDGSDFRQLTTDKRQYNRTNMGLPEHRVQGTNCPIWSTDNRLIYSHSLPGSHPDARYDGSLPNHEEFVYDPSVERGGCELSYLDPFTGEATPITPAEEGRWDFRPCLTPDEKCLFFTRAHSGKAPVICCLELTSGEIRTVTRGKNDLGADYPSFFEI